MLFESRTYSWRLACSRRRTCLMLTPGTQLRSASSSCAVIVVRPPSIEGQVRCAGNEMSPDAAAGPELSDSGTEMISLGKRYVHESSGLELLCVKPGAGPLTFAGEPLTIKAAKRLPASD